jgi:Uma2 family endonuclease
VTTAPLPGWLYPPPEGGWTVDDLFRIPVDVPRVELLDGSLILRPPRNHWHSTVKHRLWTALEPQLPDGLAVSTSMIVVLSNTSAPEPDVLIVRGPQHPDTDRYAPSDVLLAVEAVSPESVERDNDTKPHKYARAGIPHFWRIEKQEVPGGWFTTVYTYDLDPVTRAYAQTGNKDGERGVFQVSGPFPMTVDASLLYP